MKKIIFHLTAIFILLTATSGNAYCQSVMTMTTQKKELTGSMQNQTYTGRIGSKFFPSHLDIVITINNDSLRYELFNHWYCRSYAELRQITISINDINKNDSIVFKINEKSIRLIDKKYGIYKRIKSIKLCISVEKMRKISYAHKIATENGLRHFDLYEWKDLELNENEFYKKVDSNLETIKSNNER